MMEDTFIEKAVDYCKTIDRVNAAINEAARLQEKMENSIKLFHEDEKKSAAIFSKAVNFKVRASHGHDHAFNDLLIKKLEIRSFLDDGPDKLFNFSLMLVLVTENDDTYWFRIARTDNESRFYLVQCKDNGVFVIETGNDVCARFFSETDFMETLSFCYEAIDAFNKRLDIKLAEHIHYLCQTPLPRIKKDSLLPAGYLTTGMSVEIFDGSGKVGKAVISMIRSTMLDFYPGTKIIDVISCDYPRKNYSFVFIPGTDGAKEGWYLISGEYNYDPEGLVYEIKPA